MDEKEMTMREALNLALDEALQADDRVFLLGEDIADPGATGPTAGLSTKYGHDRVLDTPISEAAIVGAATEKLLSLRQWRIGLTKLDAVIDALETAQAVLNPLSGFLRRVRSKSGAARELEDVRNQIHTAYFGA